MTRKEFEQLLKANNIVFVGEAAWRVAQLVAAAERSKQARGWRTTTRRDVLRMAHHSGFSTLREDSVFMEPLENFARFVAEIEREACAKVCEDKIKAEYETGKVDHNEMAWTQACAMAIRARGKE